MNAAQSHRESNLSKFGGAKQIASQLPPVIQRLTGIKFEKLLEQVPALKKAMGGDEPKKQ
jgi:hypothetical protein